jgi:hypothetical protein
MIIGGALGAFVALIVVVCTLIFTGERLSCSSKGDRVGLTATYKVFSGCWYTLPDGREVPDDRYPPKYIEVGGQLK